MTKLKQDYTLEDGFRAVYFYGITAWLMTVIATFLIVSHEELLIVYQALSFNILGFGFGFIPAILILTYIIQRKINEGEEIK